MKTKLLLATLLLASSAFGAGFGRFGVGVGPRFGYGYRGFYGGGVVVAPPAAPYYAAPYYASPYATRYAAPVYGYGAYGYAAPYPAYGVGFGYGYGYGGYAYPRGFVGPRYYGGRSFLGGGRAGGGRGFAGGGRFYRGRR